MNYTNEELLTDLKQFITDTISEQVARLATKEDIERLDEKLDRMKDPNADTLMHVPETVDTPKRVQDSRDKDLHVFDANDTAQWDRDVTGQSQE